MPFLKSAGSTAIRIFMWGVIWIIGIDYEKRYKVTQDQNNVGL
jgi:hypothetical protein